MQHKMRRADRQISEQEAMDVLQKAEYGILSTVSEDGTPYGVPLSFCVIDNCVYIHGATEGHKVANMLGRPRVSFCVVGETCVVPSEFSTNYESAIVSGAATEVSGPEKQKALEGMLAKYAPDFLAEGLAYIQTDAAKTKVFRICIESLSGKARG
jgi:uncharacterized protein